MRSKRSLESLAGKVVVVTGASSGIGRSASVQLAALGCKVTLAARRAPDLEETARLCREAGRERGGDALVVVADVTREADIQQVIEQTLQTWGRIDVWVNNAGVTLFAKLEEGRFDQHRRVIETNAFGPMLCARAVLPIFRRQGRGTIINVGSILSEVGQPFVPSYAISKFAVRGLSEALRVELAEEPDIHVCTIFPYAVDTPHFQSGANAIGKDARAMTPAQAPEKVARGIVELAARPRRELHVPRIAALGVTLRNLLPSMSERLILRALERWHFDDDSVAPTEGNLYAPVEVREARVRGARPPRVGRLGLAAWTVRELGRIQRDSLRRRFASRGRERSSVAREEDAASTQRPPADS